MHVAKIERRHGERVYTYWLVRRSVREGKRVRHETVANGSKPPAAGIEARRRGRAGAGPGGRPGLAMVVQRLRAPGSKLACARQLSQSTLADELGLGEVDADELYGALDWLGERQPRIEARVPRPPPPPAARAGS